jgi:hypothetical protein
MTEVGEIIKVFLKTERKNYLETVRKIDQLEEWTHALDRGVA